MPDVQERYYCGEPGCDDWFKTPAVRGKHRLLIHGIIGQSKTARKYRQSRGIADPKDLSEYPLSARDREALRRDLLALSGGEWAKRFGRGPKIVIEAIKFIARTDFKQQIRLPYEPSEVTIAHP